MESPLAEKLWRVSRILSISPFDPKLLDHTSIQIDFILEMFARDNPEDYEFVRPGKPKPLPDAEVLASWERRLLAKAHSDFLTSMLPSAAVLKRAAEIAGATAFLRQAASGKPPEDAGDKRDGQGSIPDTSGTADQPVRK